MNVLITYGLVVFLAILAQAVIIRWIFRIDAQVKLLTEIRDLLDSRPNLIRPSN